MKQIKQFKFTDKAIKALPSNPSDSNVTELEVSDTLVPGLKCLISCTGNKRFRLRYSYQGRKQSISLGRFGDITVSTARDSAQKYRVMLAAGVNPRADKQAASKLTVNAFFYDHYLPNIKKRKKTWRDDQYRYDIMIAPTLGHVPYQDLTTLDVEKLHLGLTETINKHGKPYAPASCNQALMVIKSLTKSLYGLNLVDNDVSLPVKLYRLDNARLRFLNIEEIKLLLDASFSYVNKSIAGYVALLTLTGLRCSEASNIKWTDIDFEQRIIFIAKTKNGSARTIHLTSKMLTFIEQIQPIPENPYLFAGKVKGQPLKSARKSFKKLLIRAGIDSTGVCLHTLRHSLGSNLASNGVSLRLIQEQLQHKSIFSTQRYAKLTTESMRQTSETFSNLLT
ncbi:tyrosine-type recombinase/integrase [Shewanella vesiculosa]|uniref:tyrosine-type recombinase/integrase n=1 Tax=Shewanella vesiculosa TaxID=518738 RepID=UPI00384F8C28